MQINSREDLLKQLCLLESVLTKEERLELLREINRIIEEMNLAKEGEIPY